MLVAIIPAMSQQHQRPFTSTCTLPNKNSFNRFPTFALIFSLLYIINIKLMPSFQLTSEVTMNYLNRYIRRIGRKFAAYQEKKVVYTANLRYKIPDKGY
jgi:hypothetical protein